MIKTLDPKQNPSQPTSAPGDVAASATTNALKSQLSEKERMIESMEHETEKARAVREMEERLISSAFYNLSMQMHRTAVENRLSNVHSSSSTHGQSFLARQRQAGYQAAGAGGAGTARAADAASGQGNAAAFLHYDSRGGYE